MWCALKRETTLNSMKVWKFIYAQAKHLYKPVWPTMHALLKLLSNDTFPIMHRLHTRCGVSSVVPSCVINSLTFSVHISLCGPALTDTWHWRRSTIWSRCPVGSPIVHSRCSRRKLGMRWSRPRGRSITWGRLTIRRRFLWGSELSDSTSRISLYTNHAAGCKFLTPIGWRHL